MKAQRKPAAPVAPLLQLVRERTQCERSAIPDGHHSVTILMSEDADGLGRRDILGQADRWRWTAIYGFAHFGKSLFWYSSEILFAYFLTKYVGLSAAHMGVVLAAGFLVSALLDLAIGAGLHRRLASAGSASRLQLDGALLCSAALALVFLGALLPVEARFACAIAAGITFRSAFACYDIPQNALMALATSDADNRFRVAAMRILGSGTATLPVAAAVGPVVSLRGHSAGPLILLGLTGLFAVIAVGSA